MYDELVKELREAEKEAKELFTNPYRFIPYYGKAADAIEELSRGVSVWAKRAMAWAAEAEKAHRWIPVEERLPEPYVDVIATDGENVGVASYQVKGKYWLGDGLFDDTHIEVTHWMPLPEPPKEEA